MQELWLKNTRDVNSITKVSIINISKVFLSKSSNKNLNQDTYYNYNKKKSLK